MRPSKYVQEAASYCETHLKEQCGDKYSLVKYLGNTFAYHYEPEFNVSDPLNPEMVLYHQSLIGIVQYMVKLGHFDISNDVSRLSFQNAYPRKGHFLTALYIMYRLKRKHNYRLDIDLNYPAIVYENSDNEKD